LCNFVPWRLCGKKILFGATQFSKLNFEYICINKSIIRNMSEDTTNKNVRNDEIDLLDLFNRMGRTIRKWMNALGRAVLITIVFMIKKWIPLTISIIIGILIAFLIGKTVAETFSSDLILRNNIVTNAEMIEYVDRLHNYYQQGQYTELSTLMKLPQDITSEIADIEAFWIISNRRERIPLYVDYNKKYTVADTANIRMQDRMAIRLISKSRIDLIKAQNGILDFINSDPLMQQRNRVRLRQNREMLDRLYTDIAELDSLQKLKYFEETRNNNSEKAAQMIFLQQQNTQLVYSDIHTLYTRKQSLEADRDLYYDIVTVLSDFSLPEVRKDSGVLFGKNIVVIVFLVTMVVLVLLANRKKLEEIYNKY